MSDNKNINDEYQYVEESDLSTENPELTETSAAFEAEEKNSFGQKFNDFMTGSPKLRNSVIVILAIFIVVMIAKCTSGSQEVKLGENAAKNKAAVVPVQKPAPTDSLQQQANMQEITQISAAQKNIQDSLSSLTQQLNQLSSQVNSINSIIQSYPQDISGIAAKLSMMEQTLEDIKTKMKTQKVSTVVVKPKVKDYSLPRFVAESTTYYIQAIIPGRAWLISSSGATMTVTVGSRVPGYGVVEKIDALQGVVEVSSNRVLRFNQRL